MSPITPSPHSNAGLTELLRSLTPVRAWKGGAKFTAAMLIDAHKALIAHYPDPVKRLSTVLALIKTEEVMEQDAPSADLNLFLFWRQVMKIDALSLSEHGKIKCMIHMLRDSALDGSGVDGVFNRWDTLDRLRSPLFCTASVSYAEQLALHLHLGGSRSTLNAAVSVEFNSINTSYGKLFKQNEIKKIADLTEKPAGSLDQKKASEIIDVLDTAAGVKAQQKESSLFKRGAIENRSSGLLSLGAADVLHLDFWESVKVLLEETAAFEKEWAPGKKENSRLLYNELLGMIARFWYPLEQLSENAHHEIERRWDELLFDPLLLPSAVRDRWEVALKKPIQDHAPLFSKAMECSLPMISWVLKKPHKGMDDELSAELMMVISFVYLRQVQQSGIQNHWNTDLADKLEQSIAKGKNIGSASARLSSKAWMERYCWAPKAESDSSIAGQLRHTFEESIYSIAAEVNTLDQSECLTAMGDWKDANPGHTQGALLGQAVRQIREANEWIITRSVADEVRKNAVSVSLKTSVAVKKSQPRRT